MPKIKRILLAEDNENDVELTLNALQECRLSNEVEVVHDGAEALDYVYQRGAFSGRGDGLPCVILLDLKMPRMHGLEVLAWIRTQPVLKRLVVIVLTASSNGSEINRAYDLGANSYLIKPVELDALIEMVKAIGAYWMVLNRRPGV